jgi:hypothetical protein
VLDEGNMNFGAMDLGGEFAEATVAYRSTRLRRESNLLMMNKGRNYTMDAPHNHED